MKLTTFLRCFVNGRCPSRKLPATLELTGIRNSMRRLWNASIRHIENRVVLEHAATPVCDTEGKVQLVHPVAGAPDGVVPNYGSRKTMILQKARTLSGLSIRILMKTV